MTATAGAAALLTSLEGFAHSALLAAPPNAKKLRIEIIGCGSVSNRYISHLQTADKLQIVSLCDTRPERAREQNEKYKIGAKCYPNISEMLAGEPMVK